MSIKLITIQSQIMTVRRQTGETKINKPNLINGTTPIELVTKS